MYVYQLLKLANSSVTLPPNFPNSHLKLKHSELLCNINIPHSLLLKTQNIERIENNPCLGL